MGIEILGMQVIRNWTIQEQEIALRILPPNRRNRLMKLLQQEKRREPIAAWLLLLFGLQKQYGWNDFPSISYTALGKPFFQNHPRVQFNVSHTDGAVLAALGNDAVGVDIEKLRPVGERLKKKMGAGQSDHAFLRNWVCLEACTKREGIGVLPHMDMMSFLKEKQGYQEVNVFKGYAAGVAFLSGEKSSSVQIVEQEEIASFLMQIHEN